jgi:hypothetical protein
MRWGRKKNIAIAVLIAISLLAVPGFFLLSLAVGGGLDPLTPEQVKERDEQNLQLAMGQAPADQNGYDSELRTELYKASAYESLKQSLSSASDWALFLTSHLVIFGILIWSFREVLFSRDENQLPLTEFNWPLYGMGLALLVAGPVTGFLRPYGSWPQASWWPLVIGNLLFFIGFVEIGTASKPRNSYFKGLFLAAIAYLSIGLSWSLTYRIFIGEVGGLEFTNVIMQPAGFVIFSLLWPSYLSLWLELFGLSFF